MSRRIPAPGRAATFISDSLADARSSAPDGNDESQTYFPYELIGMNLAENLRSEFRSRVEGVALIGQTKETLAVDLHIVFENEEVSIPRDRELMSQIHSIRKTATETGYSRYDTEKNEKHHGDRMWALALAVHAAGITRQRKRKRKAVTASIV